ncbi:MAG: succinate dehydrogenase/fumarate reductase iron-sulfur subunit [Acaryochloris sp. RU_4_1]|nr:succinate dehydrogenase/fumarate reductase iron-sulfur subunit [Acaryochloris sp. RU_4_1]NJN37608.1 succinate dehydrogenase/fumarate reductase iron-sulfur subunit [Acaryochloridaceae cyanobacterium CSU_3_4]NJR55329.1 succinate dehydrogenase/fumarate reductase iron-sulfur subunit [Acaryochloris sp. CRU_2_0]
MQVLFKINRQQGNSALRVQTYTLEVDPSTTILECLNRIKWEQDGSLAFRKNCRNTICGSCGMRINQRAALACQQNVQAEVARFHQIMPAPNLEGENEDQAALPVIEIAPMGNMPVIKDLVVQMDRFWQNLDAVKPYVSSAGRQIPEREFLQSPADRSKLDQTGNCILCGACYSDCNALETNENFVGPHALAKAYRLLADTRDQSSSQRLEQYNQDLQGVWGCTRCFNCNAVCPMGVAPLDQISQIKAGIFQQTALPSTRPLRHRQTLIDLVQKGGWVDERKFGLQVLGNNCKDIPGLWSLIPLGWQLLIHGKFPRTFEASQGTQEVRSLIQSIKRLKLFSAKPMSSSSSQTPPVKKNS